MIKLFSTPSTTPGLFGGGLLGYVIYDCTHYYLHHGQPSSDPAKYLKVLSSLSLLKLIQPHSSVSCSTHTALCCVPQKYHLNHHFRIQTKGFGITSTLWDHVFGTLPSTKTVDKSIWFWLDLLLCKALIVMLGFARIACVHFLRPASLFHHVDLALAVSLFFFISSRGL